jgi:hypothetical protein
MTNIAKNYSYKNSLIPEAKVETQNYGCIFLLCPFENYCTCIKKHYILAADSMLTCHVKKLHLLGWHRRFKELK